MQRLPDGSFRYSPRDLNAFLEGDFVAWCERNHAERSRGSGRGSIAGGELVPDEPDEEMDLVIRRGLAHEAAHLEQLKAREPALVEIPRSGEPFERTITAMQAAAPIIFQGELRSASWMGIADFLHRLDGPSSLGAHHYEPWDTKLARSAKPHFLLQLCAYADMLESMQGVRPERLGFILGDGSEASFRTADFWHYYRRLKGSFESFQEGWTSDTIPDAALDREHGRWSLSAERILEHVDDLSLVAGITRSQIIRLREAGIQTVAELARSAGRKIPRLNSNTVEGLCAQAAMQVATRKSGEIAWASRAPDPERPRRGLALLPPTSPNDIFFDIEGFPFAPGGLEYLLGVVTVDQGSATFRDWWAHDEAEEKRAFEEFIDWAFARWSADRSLHIYHYAAYERTALGRLMGKYATREWEVDQLFRHDVLVDLYPIVLQSMVIGTPSYSLKAIEKLYMPPRTEEITSAGGSVVEYQKWIDSGEPGDWQDSPLLHAIREYNRVDCESTVGLRDWLLARQREAGTTWIAPEVAAASATDRDPSAAEELATDLLRRAETMTDEENQRITRLLAWLLEFHRREEKPWWWRYFERMEAQEEQLFDDIDCLAGLVRTDDPPVPIKRSMGFGYRFDPDQDTRLSAGDSCAIAGNGEFKCAIDSLDRDAGTIVLKVGPGKFLPDRLSIFPGNLIGTEPLREGILRVVEGWAVDANRYPALADLLHRRAPRLVDAEGPFRFDEDTELTAQAIDVVSRLDGSTLCIQGPPGTGKTTTAAAMILALLARGKRVGIVANGHQVVLNLLERIAVQGAQQNVTPSLIKVGGDGDHPLMASGRIGHIESKGAADAISTGPLAIGGTAWLFARPELVGTLDHLFIEEAGQFSLANTVAVAACATNLVLLGDQMQLAQPVQGSHPGESGLSALDYLLQDRQTIPADLGIFLGTSYRMHPEVCRLISDAHYEGRLESAPATDANRIVGAAGTAARMEAGVRFIAVGHDGCTQESEEEVECIANLVTELLQCAVEVKGKPARPMAPDDILIVAPFNMQVRALKARLGPTVRIGSVDKFQGQEAPVVIVSMCASTLDDAPRGPEFLLSPNRLNVAISRAQALAVVVGSPKLGEMRARSVAEMRLVSGWCRVESLVVGR